MTSQNISLLNNIQQAYILTIQQAYILTIQQAYILTIQQAYIMIHIYLQHGEKST